MTKSQKIAKVPVVMQMEALECGAACLTMILAYYGKWVPIEEVREVCGVSRDGSKASYILRAARSYGLNADGYKKELDALRNSTKFPCIIHWNFEHFIVLDGFKGDKVYVNDPAGGKYTMSIEQFDMGYTGIVLEFSPSETFEKTQKSKAFGEFITKKIVECIPQIIIIAVVTAVFALAGSAWPIVKSYFFDEVLIAKDAAWIYPIITCFGILAVLQVVAQIVSDYFMLKIGGKFSVKGNLEFMWKLLNLPMRFYSQHMTGDLLDRQAANATVYETITNTLGPLALKVIMMAFYLIVMVRYSPVLALIGIVSLTINALISNYIAKKQLNIIRASSVEFGRQSGAITSGLRMIDTIKASGAEKAFFTQWAGYDAKYNRMLVEQDKLKYRYGMLPTMLTQATSIIILGIAVYCTTIGYLSLGIATAIQGLFMNFSAPAQELVDASQVFQTIQAQIERIEDVFKYPSEDDYVMDDNTDFQKLKGHIELKNVTFGYSPLDPPLIKDFSLEIKKGSRIAIVGASGCGKSTISKLISGLYKPWSGEILFDGNPINTIDTRIFKSSVSVVDQDIVMFEDTIANNIKLLDNTIEDYEMILASRDAMIHEDIASRKGAYQSRLIEGGKNLSGGQRQRIEIARVLAEDPTIVILDEATSALDASTEYDVVKSVKDRGITCIVIAHRLSTIRDCDEIIVLDKGTIVERGTHDELINKSGIYTSLVTNE